MLYYLGWIIAAFLAGLLLAGWLQRRGSTLQQRAERLGVFAGRGYTEILRAMNTPHAEERLKDGRAVRTWRGDGYSISLLFDARDVCLGVKDESSTQSH